MTNQNRLNYLVKLIFDELGVCKIKNIEAVWEDNVAYVKIYLFSKLDEKEKEDIETGLAEIMAQFEEGTLKEEYILVTSSN